jgi:hypothetical protein
MHATLLTLILVTGAPACDEKTNDQDSKHTTADADQGEGGCDVCNQSDDGARNRRLLRGGLMPQSCYGPAYGCYPGNDRRIQRYPAFHGHYYRKPYNYRNEFDYPWHAGLHEPTSLFSYNVVSERTNGNGTDQTLPSSLDDNAAPPPPQRMSSRSSNPSSVITQQRSLDR